LHCAVAPEGALPEAVVAAAGFAGAGFAGAGAAEPAAVALAAAGAGEDELDAGAVAEVPAFCTPPCFEQAPRPVAVEVVPSLQVVGAGVWAPAPKASTRSGAASRDASVFGFIFLHSCV
jgi:hypothetical protein